MRRERPHQGAQLRFEDVGDYRLTAFATNTKAGQLADLEVRHRLRARCQGTASAVPRTPGCFPLQGFAQNRIWRLIHSIRQKCSDLRRCWSRLALWISLMVSILSIHGKKNSPSPKNTTHPTNVPQQARALGDHHRVPTPQAGASRHWVQGLQVQHPLALPGGDLLPPAPSRAVTSASSWAGPRCSTIRRTPPDLETICTAVAPEAVLTLRTNGLTPLHHTGS